jgi:hypothetical protein
MKTFLIILIMLSAIFIPIFALGKKTRKNLGGLILVLLLLLSLFIAFVLTVIKQ